MHGRLLDRITCVCKTLQPVEKLLEWVEEGEQVHGKIFFGPGSLDNKIGQRNDIMASISKETQSGNTVTGRGGGRGRGSGMSSQQLRQRRFQILKDKAQEDQQDKTNYGWKLVNREWNNASNTWQK